VVNETEVMIDLSGFQYIPAEKKWRAFYKTDIEICFDGEASDPDAKQVEYAKGVLVYFPILFEWTKQYLSYFVDFTRIEILDSEWVVSWVDFSDSLNSDPPSFTFYLNHDDDIYGQWSVRFNHWVKQKGEFHPVEFSRKAV
jgi:hypothetical protein